MIGKIRWGTRVAGLIYYLYGPGQANEHVDPRIVAGWRDPHELEPPFRPDGNRDFRYLIGLLNQPLAALFSKGYSAPVWHCSVRAAPEDRFLTDAEWRRIAGMVMDRTGLAAADDPEALRWVAIRHAADHVHIVATLARQDGRLPKTWGVYQQLREACRQAEEEFELRRTAPMDRTAAAGATRAETEKAARCGRTEPTRHHLRRAVVTAAAASHTEAGFFAALEAAGLLVHRRTAPGSARPVGYAVADRADRSRSGDPVWFSGGRLAPDLTLPRLRRRWSAEPDDVPRVPVPGRGLSAPSARAVLRTAAESAARNARNEAEYLRRLREDGVRVRVRFSDRNPTQITGYALHVPGHVDEHGAEIWFPAAKLDAGLSLPTLRRTWGTATASGLSFAERDAIWRDAARTASEAADVLRGLKGHDPQAAADIAWATSDILHAAAARLGGDRLLRRAADAYDRAARPPYRLIPAPSAYGERLRGAARMLSLLGHSSQNRTLTALAAMAHLAGLAAAVADLRDRQHHQAQRDAARAAADHLHRIRCFTPQSEPTPAVAALATAEFPTAPTAAGRTDQPAGTPPTRGRPASPSPTHPNRRSDRR